MIVIGVSPGNTETGGSAGSGCGGAIDAGTSGRRWLGGTVVSVCCGAVVVGEVVGGAGAAVVGVAVLGVVVGG